MVKKFQASFVMHSYAVAEVEADSVEEAQQKFDKLQEDGALFFEYGDGSEQIEMHEIEN